MRTFEAALATFILTLALAAPPAAAAGPTEPPAGDFEGYTVAYYLGRMYASGTQETIVTCNNLGAALVQVAYEVWNNPSADPVVADSFSVPAGGTNAWGTPGDPGLALARLSVSDPRAALFCTAHVQDATGVRGFIPLLQVGKPPKIAIK